MPPEAQIAFIDLASSPGAREVELPPYPLIGIGDRAHPLATALDAVIEPPMSADRIAAQVSDRPLTAAAVVRLLRMLAHLDMEQGLVAESATYAMLQGSREHQDWLRDRSGQAAAMPAPGAILAEREGSHLRITLDRPHAGNAIDCAMRDGLYEALALAALDREIASVELRARGRAFSLGADLTEFGTTTDPATAHAIRARTLPAIQATRCAHKLEVHVDGACIGAGLEIAAFARRLTASSRAWFHLPELAMGILPGAGGCVSLTRRIGRQRTALLILSGQRLGARRAREWGLVDVLVDEPT